MSTNGFCTLCGAPRTAGTNFCTSCGGAQSGGSAPRPAIAPASRQVNAIAAGALLLAIGGAATWFAMQTPTDVPRAVAGSPGGGAAPGQGQAQGEGLPPGHPSIELPKEVVAFLEEPDRGGREGSGRASRPRRSWPARATAPPSSTSRTARRPSRPSRSCSPSTRATSKACASPRTSRTTRATSPRPKRASAPSSTRPTEIALGSPGAFSRKARKRFSASGKSPASYERFAAMRRPSRLPGSRANSFARACSAGARYDSLMTVAR